MKRPKVTTLIFGNPIVATALIAATGFMLYHWWTQTDTSSSVQPLLAGFVVWMVVTSSNRVAEYKSWERNWNAMESGNSLAEKSTVDLPGCVSQLVLSFGLAGPTGCQSIVICVELRTMTSSR